MLKVIWLPSAVDDLAQITTYISERNLPAARRLQDLIERCAERVGDHLFMYRRGRVAGMREAVVHPNYLMMYRVGADLVEIVNVVHARRSYP